MQKNAQLKSPHLAPFFVVNDQNDWWDGSVKGLKMDFITSQIHAETFVKHLW